MFMFWYATILEFDRKNDEQKFGVYRKLLRKLPFIISFLLCKYACKEFNIWSLIVLFYQNCDADTSIKKLIGNHQEYSVPIGHTVGNIEEQEQQRHAMAMFQQFSATVWCLLTLTGRVPCFVVLIDFDSMMSHCHMVGWRVLCARQIWSFDLKHWMHCIACIHSTLSLRSACRLNKRKVKVQRTQKYFCDR